MLPSLPVTQTHPLSLEENVLILITTKTSCAKPLQNNHHHHPPVIPFLLPEPVNGTAQAHTSTLSLTPSSSTND